MSLTFKTYDDLKGWAKSCPQFMPQADQADQFLKSIAEQMVQNPLLKWYVSRSGGPISNPAEALGERAALVYVCASGAMALPYEEHIGAGKQSESNKRLALAGRLLMAQCFLWANAIFESARECPVPRHVIDRSAMPMPIMFWSHETDYNVHHEAPLDVIGGALIMECGMEDGGEGIAVYTLGSKDGVATAIQGAVPYGKTFPDDFLEGPEREAARIILSMLAFLNSPFIGAEPQRLNRALRRQLQRHFERPDLEEQTVRVVALRSEVRERLAKVAPQNIDFQHRWIVRGHHRAQWYPGTQSHKLIWIAPYIKGPVGKPFLEKVYAVVR